MNVLLIVNFDRFDLLKLKVCLPPAASSWIVVFIYFNYTLVLNSWKFIFNNIKYPTDDERKFHLRTAIV